MFLIFVFLAFSCSFDCCGASYYIFNAFYRDNVFELFGKHLVAMINFHQYIQFVSTKTLVVCDIIVECTEIRHELIISTDCFLVQKNG